MRKKIYIMVLLMMLMFPFSVYAAPTGSTTCSSNGTVSVNNTITVTVRGNSSDTMWDTTLSYDSSKLELIGGSGARNISDSFSTSITYTYTFKAKQPGNAYVKTSSVVSDYYGEKNYFSSSCSVNVVNASSSSGSNNNKNNNSVKKNSDNNLKSLSIENFQITPEFNKDTLEYSLEVPSATTKLKINADVNDSKARVSGTGEIDVNEGLNKLEVIVTAENGSTKTYVINVNVLEKDPIIVKVNGNKLSLVRRRDKLEAPEGYEEFTVNINDEEIPAYKSEITGYVLVGLTDKDGKVSLYIFDDNNLTYTKYNEIKTDSIRVILIKPNKKDIPYRYTKSNFELNGEIVEGYAYDEGSDFRVIYGMNILNGEKSFYVYDIKEKTLQRLYNDQTKLYIDLVKKCKYAFYIAGGVITLLLLTIIILIGKNIKFKKRFLSKIEKPMQKKKEKIEYKNIEATQAINILDKKIVDDKKEKRSKKEKKIKEKTFLDE